MYIYPFNFRLPAIYKITNHKTNKVYIGSTTNIITRQYDHFRLLNKNKHPNKHLQRSWNKYGPTIFSLLPLENTKKEDMLIREQYWIDFYNSLKNGFNKIRPMLTKGTLEYDERSKRRKRYRENNLEKCKQAVKKSKQKFKETYPEQFKENNKKYSIKFRENNPQKAKEINKKYQDKNREELNKKSREKRANMTPEELEILRRKDRERYHKNKI